MRYAVFKNGLAYIIGSVMTINTSPASSYPKKVGFILCMKKIRWFKSAMMNEQIIYQFIFFKLFFNKLIIIFKS